MARARTLKKIVWALFAVCLLAAVLAAVWLYRIFAEYRSGEGGYDAIRAAVVSQQETVRQEAPEEPIPSPFEQLEAACPGMTAWISIEGTPIDYPIMQAQDNSTYLTLTADGQKNVAGSIFLDCRNSGGYTDKNSIIYGHALKNEKMFGSLFHYMDSAYWKEHPEITLITPEGVFAYEIFSAYATTATSASYTLEFPAETDFNEFLVYIKARSAYDTGITVSGEDSILTLSTCTNRNQDGRYVVHARRK